MVTELAGWPVSPEQNCLVEFCVSSGLAVHWEGTSAWALDHHVSPVVKTNNQTQTQGRVPSVKL